jgi:iron complex transport system substrate-binding protein
VCAVRYQDVIDFVSAESALAKTKVVALNPLSLNDILADVHRVGEAADVPLSAAAYKMGLIRRISHISNRASSADRPTVVCLEWLGPLMAAGNWTPELIELAGGRSCLAEPGRHSGYIEWDAVRAVEPDVLLIAPCGFDLARSSLESRRLFNLPGFRELTAVRTGRAFVIDGNAYLNRSGPRIVDSLEILAHLIRPDLFELPAGELSEGWAWCKVG